MAYRPPIRGTPPAAVEEYVRDILDHEELLATTGSEDGGDLDDIEDSFRSGDAASGQFPLKHSPFVIPENLEMDTGYRATISLLNDLAQSLNHWFIMLKLYIVLGWVEHPRFIAVGCASLTKFALDTRDQLCEEMQWYRNAARAVIQRIHIVLDAEKALDDTGEARNNGMYDRAVKLVDWMCRYCDCCDSWTEGMQKALVWTRKEKSLYDTKPIDLFFQRSLKNWKLMAYYDDEEVYYPGVNGHQGINFAEVQYLWPEREKCTFQFTACVNFARFLTMGYKMAVANGIVPARTVTFALGRCIQEAYGECVKNYEWVNNFLFDVAKMSGECNEEYHIPKIFESWALTARKMLLQTINLKCVLCDRFYMAMMGINLYWLTVPLSRLVCLQKGDDLTTVDKIAKGLLFTPSRSGLRGFDYGPQNVDCLRTMPNVRYRYLLRWIRDRSTHEPENFSKAFQNYVQQGMPKSTPGVWGEKDLRGGLDRGRLNEDIQWHFAQDRIYFTGEELSILLRTHNYLKQESR